MGICGKMRSLTRIRIVRPTRELPAIDLRNRSRNGISQFIGGTVT